MTKMLFVGKQTTCHLLAVSAGVCSVTTCMCPFNVIFSSDNFSNPLFFIPPHHPPGRQDDWGVPCGAVACMG